MSSRTGAPFRRRRRGPVVAVVAVLAVLATVTWVVILTGAAGPGGPQACPTSTVGSPGEPLQPDALDGVDPAPPADVLARAFNAGSQRGQANLVAAQLDDLGFGSAGAPDNDPFYPDGDMDCLGQLRFGPAGEASASTLALVLPCVELVRDMRPDATVDIAVGTGFNDIDPPRPVRDVLEALGAPSPADEGESDAPVAVDPAALAAAREIDC